jgi:hypothetical protein
VRVERAASRRFRRISRDEHLARRRGAQFDDAVRHCALGAGPNGFQATNEVKRDSPRPKHTTCLLSPDPTLLRLRSQKRRFSAFLDAHTAVPQSSLACNAGAHIPPLGKCFVFLSPRGGAGRAWNGWREFTSRGHTVPTCAKYFARMRFFLLRPRSAMAMA